VKIRAEAVKKSVFVHIKCRRCALERTEWREPWEGRDSLEIERLHVI